MMRLFISYAHLDEALVRQLTELLRDGGHDPWFDHHLIPGREWKQQLQDAIEECDAFVYALTPESVASEWCQWEFAQAVERGKPVIPVLLKKTPLPEVLSRRQYADFSNGMTPGSVAKLMRGIAITIPPEDAPAAPYNPRGKPSLAQNAPTQVTLTTRSILTFAFVLSIVIIGISVVVSNMLNGAFQNPNGTLTSLNITETASQQSQDDGQIPTHTATYSADDLQKTIEALATQPPTATPIEMVPSATATGQPTVAPSSTATTENPPTQTSTSSPTRTPSPTPTDTPAPSPTVGAVSQTRASAYAVVNVDSANLRSGPGTSFTRAGTVLKGMRLPIIAMVSDVYGTWYLIEDSGGESAWIARSIVDVDPSTADIAVAATVPAEPFTNLPATFTGFGRATYYVVARAGTHIQITVTTTDAPNGQCYVYVKDDVLHTIGLDNSDAPTVSTAGDSRASISADLTRTGRYSIDAYCQLWKLGSGDPMIQYNYTVRVEAT